MSYYVYPAIFSSCIHDVVSNNCKLYVRWMFIPGYLTFDFNPRLPLRWVLTGITCNTNAGYSGTPATSACATDNSVVTLTGCSGKLAFNSNFSPLRETLIKRGDDKNYVWTKVAPNPSRIHRTTKNMILCKNRMFIFSLIPCFVRYCGLLPLKKWPCTSLL